MTAEPLVESGFAHDLRVAKNNPACPWRSGHPCHLAGVNNPMGPFQRCLLRTLNEIRRELEFRRSG